MHQMRRNSRIFPYALSSLHHRTDIDGLRCLAIVPVVLYHAHVPAFASGFVGVDVFLVISGFLISGIIDRQVRAGAFDLKAFWVRRLRRLLPALLTLVVVVQLLSTFIINGRELKLSGVAGASAIAGLSNIYFWWSTNYFGPGQSYNPFLMTWSLGLEMQFYLIFPLIMMGIGKRPPTVGMATLGLLTAASLLICLILDRYANGFAFYMLPARFWELSAGAMLALCHLYHSPPGKPTATTQALAVGGLAMVLYAATMLDQSHYPGVATLLPVAGTLALLHSRHSWINRRLLCWRPLVIVGLISYSLYLWHMPLLELTELVTLGQPAPSVQATVILLSLVLAYLSWRFIEIRFRTRYADGPDSRVLPYAAATASVGAILLTTILISDAPQRLPLAARMAERQFNKDKADTCLAAYGSATPVAGPCLAPTPRGSYGVALLGDSHAAALGAGVAEKLRASGRHLIQIEKSACQPILGLDQPRPGRSTHAAECLLFNEAAFRRVARDPTISTVLLSAFWSASTVRPVRVEGPAQESSVLPPAGAAAFGRALADTIRRYRVAGKRVVIIGDVPLFRFNPAHAAMGDVIPARRMLRGLLGAPEDIRDGYGPRRWLRSSATADRAVAQAIMAVPGTRYVSLRSALCDRRGCRYASHDQLPYYTDYHHLSRAGADAALAETTF